MDTSGEFELSDISHSQILFSVDNKGNFSIIPSTNTFSD